MDLVCFDLETTYEGSSKCRIIQIAAQRPFFEPEHALHSEEKFDTFVDLQRPIDYRCTQLTGITNEHLLGAPSLSDALRRFLTFLGKSERPRQTILCAHNAWGFDFRVLLREMDQCFLTFSAFGLEDIFFLDTKDLLFGAPLTEMRGQVNSKHWALGHVYRTLFGREFENAHDARSDTQALCEILRLYPAKTLTSFARPAIGWSHVQLHTTHKNLFRRGAGKVRCTSTLPPSASSASSSTASVRCRNVYWNDTSLPFSIYWCSEHRGLKKSCETFPTARCDLR